MEPSDTELVREENEDGLRAREDSGAGGGSSRLQTEASRPARPKKRPTRGNRVDTEKRNKLTATEMQIIAWKRQSLNASLELPKKTVAEHAAAAALRAKKRATVRRGRAGFAEAFGAVDDGLDLSVVLQLEAQPIYDEFGQANENPLEIIPPPTKSPHPGRTPGGARSAYEPEKGFFREAINAFGESVGLRRGSQMSDASRSSASQPGAEAPKSSSAAARSGRRPSGQHRRNVSHSDAMGGGFEGNPAVAAALSRSPSESDAYQSGRRRSSQFSSKHGSEITSEGEQVRRSLATRSSEGEANPDGIMLRDVRSAPYRPSGHGGRLSVSTLGSEDGGSFVPNLRIDVAESLRPDIPSVPRRSLTPHSMRSEDLKIRISPRTNDASFLTDSSLQHMQGVPTQRSPKSRSNSYTASSSGSPTAAAAAAAVTTKRNSEPGMIPAPTTGRPSSIARIFDIGRMVAAQQRSPPPQSRQRQNSPPPRDMAHGLPRPDSFVPASEDGAEDDVVRVDESNVDEHTYARPKHARGLDGSSAASAAERDWQGHDDDHEYAAPDGYRSEYADEYGPDDEYGEGEGPEDEYYTDETPSDAEDDEEPRARPYQQQRPQDRWWDSRQAHVPIPYNERVARAASHILDAIYERPIKIHQRGIRAIQVYNFIHSKLWTTFRLLVGICHLGLILWEPPSMRAGNQYTAGTKTYSCELFADIGDGDKVRPFDCFDSYMYRDESEQTLLLIELGFVTLYIIDIALALYSQGLRDLLGYHGKILATDMTTAIGRAQRWDRLKLVITFLFLSDVVLNLSIPGFKLRFTRILRPLCVLIMSAELRRWFYLIALTVPRIIGLLCLIISFIGVYAIIGVHLFSDHNMYVDEYQNFDYFGTAAVSLYVLMTSENYPNIMYPPYDNDPRHGSQLYAFFFVSFLLIVMYFLSNLAVPYLFSTFKHYHQDEAKQGRFLQQTALLAAFQLLDVENQRYLEFNRFKEVLRLVRPELFHKDGQEKNEGVAECMFDELCVTEPGICYVIDFFKCCDAILTEYEVTDDSAKPSSWQPQWLKRFRREQRDWLTSVYSEVVVLTLTLVNTILLAFYGTDFISRDTIRLLAAIFIVFCAAEMLAKLSILGPHRFFEVWTNKYDIVVIGLATTALLFVNIPAINEELSDAIPSFNNFPSILISLRVLRLIPAFDNLTKLGVVVRIMPYMLYSMTLMFLFTYCWAVIGMEAFGLRIYHNLNVETYSDTNTHFDTFNAAMFTLFQCLTGENWQDIMYKAMWSTDSVVAPAIYFIFFHFFAATLLLQLVIAIYVQAFEAFQAGNEQQRGNGVAVADPNADNAARVRNAMLHMQLNQAGDAAVRFKRRESTMQSKSPIHTLARRGGLEENEQNELERMAKLGGMEEVLHVRETRIQELTKRLEDREHLLAQIKQLHRVEDQDDDSPLPLHPAAPRRTLSPLASGSEEDDEDSPQQSGRDSQGDSSSRRGSNQMPQDRVPNFGRTGDGELSEVRDSV